jgi:hypothetical protein
VTTSSHSNVKNSAKNIVPYFAWSQKVLVQTRLGMSEALTRDTETELKVFVVMSEMVFLHLLHVNGEFGVMKSGMGISLAIVVGKRIAYA